MLPLKKQTDADCVAKIAQTLLGRANLRGILHVEDALHSAAKAMEDYFGHKINEKTIGAARSLVREYR